MTNHIYGTQGIETYIPYTRRNPAAIQLPSLEGVLDGLERLPAYSLLLGLCEDGLPLVLDLTDPLPGPFLIAGDDQAANSSLLYSILTAAYLSNTEAEVNLHLISPDADELYELHKQPSFRIGFRPERPEVEIVLEELVNLVHQRLDSGELQPIQILAIDQLDRLLNRLSPQGLTNFHWLLGHSSQAGLWLFAAIQSIGVKKSHFNILEHFPSRMVGQMKFPRLARFFSGVGRGELDDMLDEGQYFVQAGSETFILWPLPADE